MAIDTRQKRASAAFLLLPFLVPGFVPDANIQSQDRAQAAWVYSGLFTAAGGVVPVVTYEFDLYITTGRSVVSYITTGQVLDLNITQQKSVALNITNSQNIDLYITQSRDAS